MAGLIHVSEGVKLLNTIGRHLIAELYGCDPLTIDNLDVIEQHMINAATTIGASVVGHTFHRFSPQGVSGSIVIAESHLSIHTWPENRYVSVDIYTCGGLDPRPGLAYLSERLSAVSLRIQEILRGLPEELDHATLQPDDVQVISRMTPATRRVEAAAAS